MAEGLVICPPTTRRPFSPIFETGRKYEYAPLGMCHRYKAQGTTVVLEKSACDPRWGLVVVEDYPIQMPTPEVVHDWAQEIETETFAGTGVERARDLARQWKHYGAFFIDHPRTKYGRTLTSLQVLSAIGVI